MVRLLTVALAALPLVAAAPKPVPTPPGVPSKEDAQSDLAKLTVAEQGSGDGYDRDKFPHWIDQGEYVPFRPC